MRRPATKKHLTLCCAVLPWISGGCANSDQETGDEDEAEWFLDADSDGYGDPSVSVRASVAPNGYVPNGLDCDDARSDIHPGALEACNEDDDDCDGEVDEDWPAQTWFSDSDDDGYGDDSRVVESCSKPEGYIDRAGDCDDQDDSVHPSAMEQCGNGRDDDCAGDGDQRCPLAGSVSLGAGWPKYMGGTAGDLAGYQLACGGDTNGDDWPEILIGESEQFTDDFAGGDSLGGYWLVPSVTDGNHTLDSVGDGLWGTEEGVYASGAARFVADMDGDTRDEVVVGAPVPQAVYLFAGPLNGFTTSSDAGAVISSERGGLGLARAAVDLGGGRVAVAGTGNVFQDDVWGAAVGAAYVFQGPLAGDVGTDDAVASLEPSVHHEYGGFGYAMCAGDLDGDGELDLVIGAPSTYSTSYPAFMAWGLTYVVYGPFSGDLRVANADGTLGDADARIAGAGTVANLGASLSCSGDTDGDGLSDILASAPDWNRWGGGRGDVFLFQGPVFGELTVEDADGRVSGATDGDYLGATYGVSLDADLNGDGHADVAVGSYADAERGEVYIFYGGVSGWQQTGDADATLRGEAEGDGAGYVAGCPDLDGDGFDDLLVGAPGESTNGVWAGAAYVVYGGVW